jgi:hypothetical protein
MAPRVWSRGGNGEERQRTKAIPHGRIEVVDLDEPASVTRDVSPSWLHKGSAE